MTSIYHLSWKGINFPCNWPTPSEAYNDQKYWGGGAEYHLAVRPRQGGGCGKGDELPPMQSTKIIFLAYTLYKKLRTIILFMEIHQNSSYVQYLQ